MNTRFTSLLLTLGVAFSPLAASPAAAHEGEGHSGERWTSGRPDGHAPIGVMADHTHAAGEWMLSYRYMRMEMDGNRDGTDRVGDQGVFAEGFMVSPRSMTMEMHMLGAMYAPTDDLTLMAMLPYSRVSMDHVTRMGQRFETKTDGIGDVRATALYVLHRWARQQVHLNAGLGFPTGSIDEEDSTPAGPGQNLPYPMQLGSGTFDLHPGLTYLGQIDDWSWGAQLTGTLRLGRNDEDYSLGDRGDLTLWGARRWTDWASTSLRLDGQLWGNVDGRDDRLNPAMVPTADPNRRGGERIDVLVGLNLHGRAGWVKGQRIAAEAGLPVYQSLDGPQLETDWLLTAGWQYAW